MKPDWDKLMKKDLGEVALVADVDCTAGGKPLCEANGVKGFPTLKWGDPDSLEDYNGGRSYKDLLKFAKKNLKPLCSPNNLDICSDEKKAEIEKMMALSEDELDKIIEEKEELLEKAEETFKAEVDKLQSTYAKLQEDKEKTEAEIKASGLGMMKSVRAFMDQKTKDEL